MGKVLISFLGTGPNHGEKGEQRKYNKTEYRFDNGEEYPTSFVADALYKHYNIDRLILIGTPHSMWERVYEVFCENSGIKHDDDFWCELAEACDNANAKSPLSIPNKERVEEVLGKGSHIELIHYGLNQQEIEENAAIILSLEQYLKKGDELYVDITHSFRSLSLYIMNLLLYLQNVSPKRIKIVNVSYGMLDVKRELGYAPVVNLNSVAELNEWIIGAYSFQQFGNGYKIAELIKEDEKNVSNRVCEFSDVMNLNHLHGIRNQVRKLDSLKNQEYSPIAGSIVPVVLNGFVKSFDDHKSESAFLYKVARWQYEHNNYSSAYMSLLEAILSYVVEQLELRSYGLDDLSTTEIAKFVLGKRKLNLSKDIDEGLKKEIQNEKDTFIRELGAHYLLLNRAYFNINNTRNDLAHPRDNAKSAKGMIEALNTTLEELKSIIG